MKNFKKITAALMGVIMAMGILTACGGDTSIKEFKSFFDNELTEAATKYHEIKNTVETWEDKEATEITADIEKLTADIDATTEKLETAVLSNKEVIEIKDGITKVLDECKAGLEHFKNGVENEDEELKAACAEKLKNAEAFMAEHEAAIAKFAADKGIKLGK